MTVSMRSLITIVESTGTLQGDLNALIREAKTMNITLKLAFDPKIIDLDFIGRESGAEKGSGVIIMQKLCDIADRYKARINLYAFGADPKLMGYYERFGFTVDPRGGDEASMRRLPSRKKPVTEASEEQLPDGFKPDGTEYRFTCPYGSGVVGGSFDARYCWIYEFQSDGSRSGNGRKTVQWLRQFFDKIGVDDPGIPGMVSFVFWRKMADEGLVQTMISRNGDIVFDNGQWLVDPDDEEAWD